MEGQGTATVCTSTPLPPPPTAAPVGPEENNGGEGGGGTAYNATPTQTPTLPNQTPAPTLTPTHAPAPTKPVRRRNRMIHSCLPCRQRKIRCSKATPSCINCVKADRECLYIGPRLDQAGQLRLAEIKEKQGTLERQLERDVARSASASASSLPTSWDWRGLRGGDGAGQDFGGRGPDIGRRENSSGRKTGDAGIVADEVGDDCGDEERDLECTPLVALDLTYDDDADDAGDAMDLGVRIGKMRITERIGGLSRPRISEEISATISNQRPPPASADPSFDSMSDGGISEGSLPEYLQPGDQYIVPTSGFVFGQATDQPPVLQFLPYREAANRLMTQYFAAVHPVAPCSHRPSLESTYAGFWDEIGAGFEPRPSVQAVVFAAMFSGIVSMDENTVLAEMCGVPKNNWLSSLKIGTESALSRANLLRTTKLETMQAFVMYLLALCRSEISRAHSVLVGTAVRMAECMGLHRDGEEYGLTPLETHVRRVLWHQLCFLDIRTCEAQGPRPVIRRDEYDARLPLNCDDAEITHDAAPPADRCAARWTPNTLPIIRFEINEMMRIIWLDRRRLESRKTTLTAVLAKIEHFRRRLSHKYDKILCGSGSRPDPSSSSSSSSAPAEPPEDAARRYARCVMDLLTYRLYVMALHPYHLNAGAALPARLNQLLVTSGVMVLELAMRLETDGEATAFAPRRWYAGAYQQHQAALLLAAEVHHRPATHAADRIWPCLDYVFGLDARAPRRQKVLRLLADVQDRTAVYTRLRRMRGPLHVARSVPARNAAEGIGKAGLLPPEQHQHQHQHQHQQQQQQRQRYPQRQGSLDGEGDSVKADPGQMAPPPTAMAQVPQAAGAATGRPTTLTSQMMTTFSGGVMDGGQTAWAMPMPSSQYQRPSMMSGAATGTSAPSAADPDTVMDTIDWDTVNALFPTDPHNGGLSVHGFNVPVPVPVSGAGNNNNRNSQNRNGPGVSEWGV